MFEIVSSANGDLLEQVLIGVAMLTAGGEFDGMVTLGALIGLLVVSARALITQKLELQWLLLGWMMYAAMFVPKVDVTVESLDSGDVDTVAGVPIGVAAIGTVTSALGVQMAEAFTTVFTPAGTPGNAPITAFGDALDLLAALRDPSYGDANDAAAGITPNVDVQRTISRYLRDCVLYAIAVEDSPMSLTWEQLRAAPNLLAEIEVPAVSWHTVTYLDATEPDGTAQTCQDAYAAISQQLADGSAFNTQFWEYLGAVTGVDDAETEVQNAMDYLFGVGDDGQLFMANALIAKELELADLDYQAAAGNSAGVLMRTQAIEQRRVQWATEQSLFEEVARPLMGYIEAFFYAVSPIMAFLFVLGQFGVMLFGRYLLLAAWIQLWMPIMAINNLYIHNAASDALGEIQDSGVSLLSMTGLESVWTESASWIAVGGMMAAATPLLALMLLTGSYFAMTQLTNRMAGRDFTNEKIVAPELVQPAPVAVAGPLFRHAGQFGRSPGFGDHGIDSPQLLGEVEMGRNVRQTEAHAEQLRASSVDNVSAGISTGVGQVFSRGATYARTAAESLNLSASESQADRWAYNTGQNIAARAGETARFSEEQTDTVTRMTSASLGGGLGVGAKGGPSGAWTMNGNAEVGMQIRSALQDAAKLTDEQMNAVDHALSAEVRESTSFGAELREARAADLRNNVTSQLSTLDEVRDSRQWNTGWTESREASRVESIVQQASESVGFEWDMPLVAYGNLLKDKVPELQALAQKHDVYPEGQEAGLRLAERHIGDADQARAAGYVQALALKGTPEATTDVMGLMMGRFGYDNGPDVTGPRSGTIDGMPQGRDGFVAPGGDVGNLDAGGLRTAATAPTQISPEEFFAGAEQQATEFFELAEAGRIQDAQAKLAEMDAQYTEWRSEHAQEHYNPRNAGEHIRDYAPLKRITEQIGMTATGAGSSYDAAYDAAIGQGRNPVVATVVATLAAAESVSSGESPARHEGMAGAREMAAEYGLSETASDWFAENAVASGMSGLMRASGEHAGYEALEQRMTAEFGDNEAARGLMEDAISQYRNENHEAMNGALEDLGYMYRAGDVGVVTDSGPAAGAGDSGGGAPASGDAAAAAPPGTAEPPPSAAQTARAPESPR